MSNHKKTGQYVSGQLRSYTIRYVASVKDGQAVVHDYEPNSKEEALAVGHELVRDGVATMFRVEGPYDLPWDYHCNYCDERHEGMCSKKV